MFFELIEYTCVLNIFAEFKLKEPKCGVISKYICIYFATGIMKDPVDLQLIGTNLDPHLIGLWTWDGSVCIGLKVDES